MEELNKLIADLRLEHARGHAICGKAANYIEKLEESIERADVAIRMALGVLTAIHNLTFMEDDDYGLENITYDISVHAKDAIKDIRVIVPELKDINALIAVRRAVELK